MKSMNVQSIQTERGNALLGIVVIIIVLLVGGVFFWNNYQMQEQKAAEARKQAAVTQTIVEQGVIEATTSTGTSTRMFRLDDNSNSKLIKIASGQDFEIMLNSPVDLAFKFDGPEYDTSLLHLNNHVHNPATGTSTTNPGTDAWQFTTLKAGATDITITASRATSTKETVNIYKATVSIK